jgi:hypothetical protein
LLPCLPGAWQAGSWTKKVNNINGEAVADRSGGSVSLSSDGSIVAIGAIYNNGNGEDSGHVRVFSFMSVLALIEVVDDIAGNNNGINVTANQLNSIIGVSGAIDGVNYSIALDNGIFVDENNPTAAEIQFIIDTVNSTLGVKDDNLINFKIFPNPAKNQFTIQLQEGLELQKVNLFNSLGQLINSTNKNIISTSNLTSGIYYVEIITDNGKASKKIVVK